MDTVDHVVAHLRVGDMRTTSEESDIEYPVGDGWRWVAGAEQIAAYQQGRWPW